MKFRVTRDGKQIGPDYPTEDKAAGALLRLQPMSIDYAMRYEGYAIVQVWDEFTTANPYAEAKA